MPVFYTLHNLFTELKVNEDPEGKTEHGKRNSKLFLLGTFIWVVIFVLLWNLKMGYFGKVGLWADSLVYGLLILLFADLFIMAYTYKSYFNRNVFWETVDDDMDHFEYNETTHKYTRKDKLPLTENDKKFLSTVANPPKSTVANPPNPPKPTESTESSEPPKVTESPKSKKINESSPKEKPSE